MPISEETVGEMTSLQLLSLQKGYSNNTAYFGKLVSETNTEGETTTYAYNGSGIHCGLLAYTVGNDSRGYSYYYDNLGRLMWVYPTEVSGDIAYNEYSNEHADYTYTGNELTSIDTASTEYNFVYDSFGNRSAVKVGNDSIVSYEYNPYNGKLKKINYANGYSLEYVYDSLERVKEIYESQNNTNTTKIYSYTYRNDGNVSECVDYKSGQRYNYVYDNNGRVTRTKVYNLSDSINYIYSSENTYDDDSKISSQTREYFYGNTVAQEAYTYVYDTRDRLTRVRRNTNEYTSYSYDTLSRVTNVVQSYFGNSSQIQYYYGYARVDSKSTNRVSSFMTTLYSSSSMTNTSYSYTYDDVGRITEIRINGTLTYSYEYDNLGQLVRENNLPANKTYTYIYDYAGNRTEKRTYSYTTGTPSGKAIIEVYSYTDSEWGDLLTAYQGGSNAITYDAIGNPISMYGTTLTWHGRRLVQYGNYTYTYNADGIRTSKTVNGVTHNYVLEGSTILAETYGNTTLRFVYDNTGIIGLYYNDVLYMFEKNMQGDVVAILNSSLTRVVEYYYDAWGNVLSTSGSMASTLGAANPIRYRSYYYDTETGWYYLQSRYYNPAWGRFISADNHINANGDLIGFNMFAYCSNNPVMFVDPTGQFWKELWDAFTQKIQQASGYFAVAAGVSQVDTPVPGPADVVSGGMLLGGVLVCAGIAIYTAITAPAPSISIPKAEEKEEAIPTTPPSSTVIYRYGGTNPGNLTPKAKDKYSGLSFSTVPMPGAAVTTIEALNATGVVYAVQDSPTHVSVRPVGATMEDWINAGSGSIWTQAVKSVVIKWDGGY